MKYLGVHFGRDGLEFMLPLQPTLPLPTFQELTEDEQKQHPGSKTLVCFFQGPNEGRAFVRETVGEIADFLQELLA